MPRGMKLPVGFANGVVHQATAFGGLGQKLLEKHGWEKGDGLGKERKGISKAIEVQKKEDQLGVRRAKMAAFLSSLLRMRLMVPLSIDR